LEAASQKPRRQKEKEITNTHATADETDTALIQLRGTSLAKPVRAVKGFQRGVNYTLQAETKKVKFELQPEAFAIGNDRNQSPPNPAQGRVGSA